MEAHLDKTVEEQESGMLCRLHRYLLLYLYLKLNSILTYKVFFLKLEWFDWIQKYFLYFYARLSSLTGLVLLWLVIIILIKAPHIPPLGAYPQHRVQQRVVPMRRSSVYFWVMERLEKQALLSATRQMDTPQNIFQLRLIPTM